MCRCLVIIGLFSTTAAVADPVTPGNRYRVGFSQDTLANDWRAAQATALREAFARHPEVKFFYTDGLGQTAKQVGDIEDLIHQRVDVLIASPRDGRVMAPVLARAYRHGIPVVLVTRGIMSDDYTTLVAPDDRAIARKAADYMAKRLGGRGRILVLRGVPTATTAIARTEGFLERIRQHEGVEVVAIKDANYLRADAIRAIEEVLAEGLRFDAIYAQSDSMASGARLALRRHGLDPAGMVIVGIDYIDEARQAIRSGEQSASFLYPTCAEETARVVLDILAGERPPRQVRVESKLITRDNVDAVAPIF